VQVKNVVVLSVAALDIFALMRKPAPVMVEVYFLVEAFNVALVILVVVIMQHNLVVPYLLGQVHVALMDVILDQLTCVVILEPAMKVEYAVALFVVIMVLSVWNLEFVVLPLPLPIIQMLLA